MKTLQLMGNCTLACGILLVALGLLLGGARGQDRPEKPAKGAKAQPAKPATPPKAKLKILVFPLKAHSAVQVQEFLGQLLQLPEEPPAPAAMMGMAAGIGTGGPGGPGAMGGRGAGMGMPGGGLGIGGGGLGALGGGFGISGLPAEPTHRVVAEQRTGSLLARGTERDLQIIADVVAVLNTPADKPLPKLKHLRAYRLRFADPEQLAETFHQLELEANIQAGPPGSKLLFVVGPEELVPEIDEAVKALDVEGKGLGRGM